MLRRGKEKYLYLRATLSGNLHMQISINVDAVYALPLIFGRAVRTGHSFVPNQKHRLWECNY